MKISRVTQIPFDELRDEYDLAIVASGYETRGSYVSARLFKQGTAIAGKRRVALGFREHCDAAARILNDQAFHKLEFEPIICEGASCEEPFRLVTHELAEKPVPRPIIRILIDITSMTRAWYGAIIRSLRDANPLSQVHVDFTYTSAEFEAPQGEYPPNRVVAPVMGFAGKTLPDKPTALIIGLGFDKDRAIGLKDLLDPQLTLVFWSNPAADERYIKHVLTVNEELLAELPEDHQFIYPVNDVVSTFRLLESVSNGLSHDWRVVMCSLGPKIFGLCSFLVATSNPELSIWRVSAGGREAAIDRKPKGEPKVLRTQWSS